MLKLYGHPESGHSYKVKLFLSLGKIEHDYQVIDISLPRNQRPQQFKDNSKFQEVPLLIHDGISYVQSNSILLHLASYYDMFGAEDDISLRQCQEWLFWESNKLGLCLPHLRFAAKFSAKEYNQGALDWLLSRFKCDIEVIETELADGRQFILGDKVTIADMSLCGYLYFADQANLELPSNVNNWLNRISKLDGWAHPYQLLSAQ